MLKALQYGANDYFIKPLNYEEIKYKVYNLIKLLSNNNDTFFVDSNNIGNFNVDFKSFMVTDKQNNEFKLTQRQVNLLKLLIDKNNEVVSREEILEKIWGYDVFIKTRTIDNVILSLRKIFERDVAPNTYFKSVRGVGYKLTI
jgi:two-component system alkaline phosphatase synthesis response regulator PhoP